MISVAERIEVVRWRCPHCHKSWASKSRAMNHSAACYKDEAARGCGTCEHDERGYPSTYDEPGEDAGCSEGVDREGMPYIVGCDQWKLARWLGGSSDREARDE